ncbi:MAG: hypothetical protein FIA99_18200, partial [Ruminiclostridium sp.]|nr:hypothetical protein [Ruminiclostridium sp.]
MQEKAKAYEKGVIYKFKLPELQPDPNQPRKYIDEQALNELEKSIKQHGVLRRRSFGI